MKTIIVVPRAFQLLDLSGPASVFGASAQGRGADDRVIAASQDGGLVTSSCGVAVQSTAFADIEVCAGDIVLVAGGGARGMEALMRDEAAGTWFRAAARVAKRHGSICSGAFALAEWGMLDRHRVTTHWRKTAKLAETYPEIDIDREAMFVEEGRLWTSAGVTAGIDMALAMVERDHGSGLANMIAQRLVLSVRRPGYQSQYSPLLKAQADTRYAGLIGWISANLDAALEVDVLAARAGETPRSFHRHFRAATGKTPGAFVAAARLDRARQLLAEGRSVKAAAGLCGYASHAQFSRKFSASFGVAPSTYRAMHATASAPPRPSSDSRRQERR
ncbi:DJ-1/PfpI family protein [Pacificimonas sp. WHA3]|uniref:DJ-1/PfpI family protein n=1 Tax=Pacificimonas pallii TaxID=2827236 RepID=A0ABS6SDV3_9SPHN|nr:helix-turn-helix domain-containing protein [Pacificimonas pallii]MBV7256278.1 DJ-1/PfpI family protein [Pacificimonas pallii]